MMRLPINGYLCTITSQPEIKRTVAVLSLWLLASSIVFPQTADTSIYPIDTSHINVTYLSAFVGSVIVGGITVHFARYEPLWGEYYSAFRFHEDFSYAQNQDKLVHFYGGVVGSVFSAKALSWAGFDEKDAVLYGSATSLAFLTYMKIEDGHIAYLGFDRVDELANVLGAIYPVAQYYVPWLNSFAPKSSYVASKNSVVLNDQRIPKFPEDHEGQRFWMGITVHDLLPENLREYWPSVIGFAVGYTVRDLNTPRPYHETILALDLDFRKLPGDSQFLRTLWQVLNYVHAPMPAVRISPLAVWHGFYF